MTDAVDINLYAEVFADDILYAWEKYLEAYGARRGFDRFIDKNEDEMSSEMRKMMNAELQRLKQEENASKAKFYKLAEEYV